MSSVAVPQGRGENESTAAAAIKGFHSTSRSSSARPSSSLHVILIRHAESANNVLSEQMRVEFGGLSPYDAEALKNEKILMEYEKRRSVDPVLSDKGEQQAKLLPLHPHLQELGLLGELATQQRVRIIVSPMLRAIRTSLPLIQNIQQQMTSNQQTPLKGLLYSEVCERGGSYRTERDETTHHQRNIKVNGSTRADLSTHYGQTHDATLIHPDGWWTPYPATGAETDSQFEERMQRVITWLQQEAFHYAIQFQNYQQQQQHSTNTQDQLHTKPPADFLVIVTHADFIDALLVRLLQLPGTPRYAFFSSNTSVSHLELDASEFVTQVDVTQAVKTTLPTVDHPQPHHPNPVSLLSDQSVAALIASGANVEAANKLKMVVRVRTTNSKPASISSEDRL